MEISPQMLFIALSGGLCSFIDCSLMPRGKPWAGTARLTGTAVWGNAYEGVFLSSHRPKDGGAGPTNSAWRFPPHLGAQTANISSAS